MTQSGVTAGLVRRGLGVLDEQGQVVRDRGAAGVSEFPPADVMTQQSCRTRYLSTLGLGQRRLKSLPGP